MMQKNFMRKYNQQKSILIESKTIFIRLCILENKFDNAIKIIQDLVKNNDKLIGAICYSVVALV